ncbi:MAG: competence protein ComEC, partial [Haliea sp.]
MFRATGVAHLMSISGLHITLFAWLAAAAVGALWRRSARLMLWRPAPQAALIGGVLLATAYALFSGWGVPAQRTIGMLAIVAWLRGGARQWPWPCVWLLVGAAVVAWDPWALLQAGFW